MKITYIILFTAQSTSAIQHRVQQEYRSLNKVFNKGY